MSGADGGLLYLVDAYAAEVETAVVEAAGNALVLAW